MKRTSPHPTWTRAAVWLLPVLAIGLLSGCATPTQTAGLAMGGVTLFGARTPAQELEQIYYVGVFDPEEQIPPTVYRLTVRGQASAFSQTRFASGWVPAGVIDSLNGRVGLEATGNGEAQFAQTNSAYNAQLKPGRRLMMFGPEGFREAPADHRLVLVMGADPRKFFELMDGAAASITGVAVERGNAALEKQLLEALLAASRSREGLRKFSDEVDKDLK